MIAATWLLSAWVSLQAEPPSEQEKLLRKAAIEQAAGRRASAQSIYEQILGAPKPTESGALKADRSARSEAQWRLAVCLEAERRFAEALSAYQDSEKNLRQSFCGNAIAEYQVEAEMGKGRCLESLGRHEEAVLAYFKATEDCLNGPNGSAVRRIADLYDAAGRTESLRKILDRRDKEFLAQFDDKALGSRLESIERMSPNRPIRRLLDVREAGRREQWGKLADLLDAPGSLYPGGKMHQSEEVVEAAHLLAARPDKAVPLLKPKIEADPERGKSWRYYALGLCGTPEAVKVLKARAEPLLRQGYHEERGWDLTDLAYALDLSGAGRMVLSEFLSSKDLGMKQNVEHVYKQSTPLRRAMSEFPAIPKDLRLN